jgi:outer membrane protein TolC
MKIALILVLIITNSRVAISQSETVSILKLEICIKAALDYSPDLKEGFIQTEIKKTETSKAKSSQFPYLYAAASYNLTDQNKLDNNYNSVSYGINANQVLWQYGKNKALLEQSKLLYQAVSNYIDNKM